ncbi:MAG: SH3 domain-containing protein [Firmicutes bacterium]|nr:SH3 domain-containing protein [Bacillota bacterium]
MSQNDDAPKSDSIFENLKLDNVIIKHAAAWVILIIIGIAVWKMAKPLLPGNLTPGAEGESTATVSRENTQTPQGESDSSKRKELSLPTGADRVQVIVNALKVRTEPDINSAKLTTLSKGDVVQVLNRKAQWLEIKTVNGEVGYIKASPEYVRAAP